MSKIQTNSKIQKISKKISVSEKPHYLKSE